MTDNNKKKTRSENWLEEDKQLLQELVKERERTIENKNVDTKTNQQKKTCWDGLLDNFNTLCSGKTRTVSQLKTQWGALKIAKKKKLALERRELMKTGGGPEASIATTSNDDIKSWLPEEFETDESKHDSDTVNSNKIVEKEETSVAELPEKYMIEIKEEELMRNDEELAPVTENNETEVIRGVGRKLPFNNSRSSASKRKRDKTSTTRYDVNATNTEVLAISSTQVECAKSLHAIQMEVENLRKENEIKKSKVLEFKEKAMQAKYEYYKLKLALLGSRLE